MKYFNSLPLVAITNEDNTTRVYRNIMARLSVIPSVLENTLAYYPYDLQAGDTPEIVAHKYYGDSYRYWIVMLSNQMLDPQWDWPLDDITLNNYIIKKYENTNINVYVDVKNYRKTITKTNSFGQITTETVNISQKEYDELIPYSKVLNFATESVSVAVDKNTQSYYEYELEQNEKKRSIKLLNKNYVPQLESEFKNLMG